jgi:hypothetical protein
MIEALIRIVLCGCVQRSNLILDNRDDPRNPLGG